MRNIALFSIGIGLFFLVSAPYMPKLFIYNSTPSIPVGFYYLSANAEPKVGDNIALVFPEKPKHQFLKPVSAVEGDFVCSQDGTLSINGSDVAVALKKDSKGNALPRTEICRKLEKDEFFVLSSHKRSYDSRYFGPVKRLQINGVIWPIWTDGL